MYIVFGLIAVALVFGQPSPAFAQVTVSCFNSNQRLAGAGTPNPHHYPVVAAHKEFAFGTIIEFFRTPEGEHKRFIVMDRGPFIKGRMFDLDCTAAHAAGFPNLGQLFYHMLGRE
jgi:hypothetical protein